MEKDEVKCSKELEIFFRGVAQRIKHLEDRDYELKRIEATLVVNFGEKGRIAQLWSGDLATNSMLMKVLEYKNKEKEK